MPSIIRLLAALALTLCAAAHANEQDRNPYVEFRIKTYEIQEKYLHRLAEHQKTVLTDTEKKLSQQIWQTTAISIVVILMILVGLTLSALQFYLDWKTGGRSSITLKLGSGSIDLSSTVIGLAILALSFWFFQTYIEQVYSIKTFEVPPLDLTTFGANR